MTTLHERRQIRDAIVTALRGHTSCGSNVFKSRTPPVREGQLPAICVYSDAEEVDEESANSAPRWLKRNLTVAIEVWAKAPTAADVEQIDDVLDALALEVETVMDVNEDLAGTVFWQWPSGTEIGIGTMGAQPVGCVKMSYLCTYKTDMRTEARDGAFDALKTVDTKYDVQDGTQADADRSETQARNLDT